MFSRTHWQIETESLPNFLANTLRDFANLFVISDGRSGRFA